MERGRKRKHLRLIKTDHPDKSISDAEQELLDELENLEELEFQILTGAPDWTVAIDRRSPTEVKLRVLAAMDPWKYRSVFDLLILIGIFMVGVHLYGFLKKNQPIIEHLEIALYLILSLLAWYFYPQPPG